MDIKVKPGKYIIAVSGGVDSVALLDLLQSNPNLELIVAHFDHGIREDSVLDRQFVAELAQKYNLPFEYEEGRLGENASEATAREGRYNFLNQTLRDYNADGIITAHHQDDVLETAIINLIRGTGRKGLSSLGSLEGVHRPAKNVSKQALVAYANDQGLVWREDSTNKDDKYLRNYVRQNVINRLDDNSRNSLINIINDNREINTLLDALLEEEMSRYESVNTISRYWFIQLPHKVAMEVMATWLRKAGIRNFDSSTLERLVIAAKTGKPNSRFNVINSAILIIEADNLALEHAER